MQVGEKDISVSRDQSAAVQAGVKARMALKHTHAKSLLLGLLVLDGDDTRALLGNTGSTPLTGSLVLDTAGLHLLSEVLGTELLGLGLVDVLHENTLVLEGVSLGLEVEGVVADGQLGEGGRA